jgi:hypothetical protein
MGGSLKNPEVSSDDAGAMATRRTRAPDDEPDHDGELARLERKREPIDGW